MSSNDNENRPDSNPTDSRIRQLNKVTDNATTTRDLAGGSGIGAASTSLSAATAKIVYVTKIEPNDVLLGRGAPIINNEGNVRFRKVVATRKVEYASSCRHQLKNKVAYEIIDEITNRRNGRFLRKVDDLTEAKELGILKSDIKSAWVTAGDSAILQKVKQALREPEENTDSIKPSPRSSIDTSARNEATSTTITSPSTAARELPGFGTAQISSLNAEQLAVLQQQQRQSVLQQHSSGIMLPQQSPSLHIAMGIRSQQQGNLESLRLLQQQLSEQQKYLILSETLTDPEQQQQMLLEQQHLQQQLLQQLALLDQQQQPVILPDNNVQQQQELNNWNFPQLNSAVPDVTVSPTDADSFPGSLVNQLIPSGTSTPFGASKSATTSSTNSNTDQQPSSTPLQHQLQLNQLQQYAAGSLPAEGFGFSNPLVMGNNGAVYTRLPAQYLSALRQQQKSQAHSTATMDSREISGHVHHEQSSLPFSDLMLMSRQQQFSGAQQTQSQQQQYQQQVPSFLQLQQQQQHQQQRLSLSLGQMHDAATFSSLLNSSNNPDQSANYAINNEDQQQLAALLEDFEQTQRVRLWEHHSPLQQQPDVNQQQQEELATLMTNLNATGQLPNSLSPAHNIFGHLTGGMINPSLSLLGTASHSAQLLGNSNNINPINVTDIQGLAQQGMTTHLEQIQGANPYGDSMEDSSSHKKPRLG